jgi:hypothetical protein
VVKTLFNLYLEEEMKKKVTDKLCKLNGDSPKGQLASLIRVLLAMFLDMPDDACNELAKAVQDEYEYTTKKNKRSNM